jgi:hypothetical protein
MKKRAQNNPVYFLVFSMQEKLDPQIYFKSGIQSTFNFISSASFW